jgi:protein-S-isoprenylcysteine O-methyltransferase Ste14
MDIRTHTLCQIETERHMSLLNPAATTTETIPSPILGLGNPGFAVLISAATLALGTSRIGSDAIVQDLHAGGFGLYLIIASYLAFIATTLFKDEATPLTLKTTGIHTFTRNPIHLAFFLPLASLAYFSPYTAFASIVIYVTLMNLTVIRREEQDLQDAHGEAYTSYRKAVPRWFA